jgi:hypothetical protein
MDDVVADLKVMKIKQWMEKMKDREKWRLIVEEAKAHPGPRGRNEGLIIHKYPNMLYTTNMQWVT